MRTPSNGHEPRWHAALAVIVALVLYVTLPPKVVAGPYWLMPTLVLVVLVPLLILSPRRHQETRLQRWLSIAMVAVLNAFNIATIVLLFVWQLSAHHHRQITGEDLLLASVEIWLTNVIVYALWFWEIDGHGPETRSHTDLFHQPRRADFLFPQMTMDPQMQPKEWKPMFLDYLFLAFTNATAFSPADTFPLSRPAKTLMMLEAITSLVTIAIIAGRAISLLGS